MKKILSIAIALITILSFASIVMAANPVAVTKADWDAFQDPKMPANNNYVDLSGLVEVDLGLSSDSKAGWFIVVNDCALKGKLEIAYKIGSAYYTEWLRIINGEDVRIGDGSGKNGINMVKIGEYIPDPPPPPDNPGKLSITINDDRFHGEGQNFCVEVYFNGTVLKSGPFYNTFNAGITLKDVEIGTYVVDVVDCLRAPGSGNKEHGPFGYTVVVFETDGVLDYTVTAY